MWCRLIVLILLIISVGCAPVSPTPIDEPFYPVQVETPMNPTPLPSSTPIPEESVILDLDLREANVLAVEFSPVESGQLKFDVTLLHDDDGEAPSYADKWIVEDLNGVVLGERILTHSHGTVAFTRSSIIFIPDDIEVVLVRGHDQEHGHGGQSMRVDLRTGNTIPFQEPGQDGE